MNKVLYYTENHELTHVFTAEPIVFGVQDGKRICAVTDREDNTIDIPIELLLGITPV